MDEASWIAAQWSAPNHIKAGCTTRVGGVSNAPFHSLNLAKHVGDNPQHVEQNRQSLADYLGLSQSPHWLQQVHGCGVSTDTHVLKEADAAMTCKVDHVCVVMTADCLPLLITNAQGTCVAAVHAGWRGLANGVVAQTINNMPVAARELLVWLGPAIGPHAFEVGEEVFRLFVEQNEQYRDAFTRNHDKWLLDIYLAARLQLGLLGVTTVSGGEYCTYENAALFYSYRREKQTGRMASLIWMKSV